MHPSGDRKAPRSSIVVGRCQDPRWDKLRLRRCSHDFIRKARFPFHLRLPSPRYSPRQRDFLAYFLKARDLSRPERTPSPQPGRCAVAVRGSLNDNNCKKHQRKAAGRAPAHDIKMFRPRRSGKRTDTPRFLPCRRSLPHTLLLGLTTTAGARCSVRVARSACLRERGSGC